MGKKLKKHFSDIITRIKDVKKEGSFIQNITYTISGNAYGILLQLIFSPILARIYSPEAYGVFGLYMAVVANISMFSLLMLPNAFVIPEKEREFSRLLQLTLFLTIFSSLVVSIAFVFFGQNIARLFDHDGVQWWYYLVGPTVFLLGIIQINSNWIVRLKLFKKTVKVGFVTGLAGRIFNLLYGILSKGSSIGLVIGEITGKLFGLFLQIKVIIGASYNSLFKSWSYKKMIWALKEFRNYPLFLLPGNYINLLAGQLPIFLFASSFGFEMVGFYTFSLAMLDMPLRLFGNAISPVFTQKAAETQNTNPERVGSITKDAFLKLLLAGLIPFGLLSAFGDYIFVFVFGNNWQMAGTICRLLSVFYLFRLAVSPISSVLAIIRKEKYGLINSGLIFLLRVISLYIGIYIINDVLITIALFSLAGIIAIFVLVFIIFSFLKQNPYSIILQVFLWGSGSVVFFNSLRWVFINLIFS